KLGRGNSFCTNCGMAIDSSSSGKKNPDTSTSYLIAKGEALYQKRRNTFLILSCIALLNAFLIPPIDATGGLFDFDYTLIDVFKLISEGYYDNYLVIFSMIIFVASVFMFLFSFAESIAPFEVTAVFAILGLVVMTIKVAAELNDTILYDFGDVFSFISLGTYIALAVFIAAIVFSVKYEKLENAGG
ncbi:MAG: hypothetical protein LUH08_05340, partial [Ruminococcus sp.]|nr:hypothetical protein [Ruminococcus sp.]